MSTGIIGSLINKIMKDYVSGLYLIRSLQCQRRIQGLARQGSRHMSSLGRAAPPEAEVIYMFYIGLSGLCTNI